MGQKPRSAKHEILWGKRTEKKAYSFPHLPQAAKLSTWSAHPMALEQNLRVCKARG